MLKRIYTWNITEKFRKYYNTYNNFNQSQSNNFNFNSQNLNWQENQNENEGKVLVINPGDFSKDNLFASINPSTLESNIYYLK